MPRKKKWPPADAKLVRVGARDLREKIKGRRYYVRFRCLFEDSEGVEFWEYSPSRVLEGRKSEAEGKAELYRAELERTIGIRSYARTVADFADEYLRGHKQQIKSGDANLSPLSVEREEIEIKRLKRYWGDVPLVQLTAGMVYEGIQRMREDGASAHTVHKCVGKFSQVIEYGIGVLCRNDSSLVIVNPCSFKFVKEAAADSKSKETVPLTREEAADLVRYIRDDVVLTGYYVCVYIAIKTGCRKGEILGLSWDDVDLDNGVVYIRNQWANDKNLRDPKTDVSVAAVVIGAKTVDFLRRWKEEQLREFERKGANQAPDSPVCSNTKCERIGPSNFDRWRRDFYVKRGLGEYVETEVYHDKSGHKRVRRSYVGKTLHAARHTQATELIAAEVEIKAVQDRLRHATPSMTMRYTHRVTEKDRETADIVDDLFE